MKLIINVLFLTISYSTFSQETIIFKPDSECGKDAIMTNSPIWNNGSTPNAIPQPSSPFLRVEAWTANSNGASEHDWRSIIEFAQLKNIQSAELNSAILVLHSYPNFPYSNGGQAETNASEVYRVIEPWEEDQVTWLTQPNIDLNEVVEIPQNNDYNLIEVEVTDMVQTMINNPDDSFGFLLRQKDENPYGSMDFASSDYPDYSRAPELILVAANIQYAPIFSQDCIDCNGTPNGTAVVDECGVCLEPNDPDFNQTCLDCNGAPNGTAVVDDCGECLDPLDLMFNQSCLRSSIFIPNTFSPNFDGVNDTFQIFKDPKLKAGIKNYTIYYRWGGIVYQKKNLDFNATSEWWDGKFKGKEVDAGVFIYYIEIEFPNGELTTHRGDISIIR